MTTALLKKLEREGSQASETSDDLFSRFWTVDALYQALNAGLLEDPKRLELIHGRIIRKMPQNPIHTFLRRRFGQLLRDSMTGFVVMEESPLRLAIDGEPVPDVFVASGSEKDYQTRHPTQAETVLVIEVSNTTADYDLGEKALLYAQSGISDYWVVLVNEAVIVRHRQPSAGGYAEVTRLADTDMLSPLALPGATWTINELLGRGEASEEN